MTEDINKMKSIRAAYTGHYTQDFKKAEKLVTSKTSDHAELEALVDRLTRRAGEIAQMDAKIVMFLETEEDILKDTEEKNLTNAYMESLSKIHAPSSDTKNLREFHDICEANICGLETLGVMTESYGSLLIPILLKKIPEDIRCLIFRTDPLPGSSLDRLRVAIRQEIETR